MAKILADLADAPSTPAEPSLILTHYVEMLRRHVVPDDDLKDLARRLYEKHREAFDFVFAARPEQQCLLEVVRTRALGIEGLDEDSRASGYFRFYPLSWEGLEILKCDPREWSRTGRGLLFEVWVDNKGAVNLALTRQALRQEDGTFRRDIVRAIAQRVEIKSKTEIEVSGCRVELMRSMAVTSGSHAAAVAVPAREPEWRALQDSNLRPFA